MIVIRRDDKRKFFVLLNKKDFHFKLQSILNVHTKFESIKEKILKDLKKKKRLIPAWLSI